MTWEGPLPGRVLREWVKQDRRGEKPGGQQGCCVRCGPTWEAQLDGAGELGGQSLTRVCPHLPEGEGFRGRVSEGRRQFPCTSSFPPAGKLASGPGGGLWKKSLRYWLLEGKAQSWVGWGHDKGLCRRGSGWRAAVTVRG